MTGMWCFGCGYRYGARAMPTLPQNMEIKPHVCDGCGELKLSIPAYLFKITVAAARRAIANRKKDEPSTKEKDHDASTNDSS